jgi:hypothetical protein
MMLMLPADSWDMHMPSMLPKNNAIYTVIYVGKLCFIALGARILWRNVLTPHSQQANGAIQARHIVLLSVLKMVSTNYIK